jgi:LacI family transcriptional regulator
MHTSTEHDQYDDGVTGATKTPRPRPTVADVAREAGVSPSTVSRALHTQGYASAEVRRRVRAAAADLGYVVNSAARSLRSRTSNAVGVLISDLRNPFYADLATGIEQVLRAEGHHMVLINDNGEPDEEMQAAETLVAMQVPGVILTPATAECPRMLRSNGVHVVCADRDVKGSGSPDVVASDNQAGAKELVAHLIGLGHRRIGLLIDETMWATGAGRLAGYRSAHDDAGIPVDPDLIVHTSFDAEDAAKKTAEVLDTTELTALFCANNVLAQGALSVLQHRRVRIPRQLSLASYDDVPWMSLVHPAMTTVDQHSVEMGRTCARLVLARIRDELPARRRIVRVPPQLVLRGSTAPPR